MTIIGEQGAEHGERPARMRRTFRDRGKIAYWSVS